MTTQLPFRPKALLLDFDGVGLDSAEVKTQAFAEIYAGAEPEVIEAILAYQRHHGGVSRREKFRYFEREVFGRDLRVPDGHGRPLGCPYRPSKPVRVTRTGARLGAAFPAPELMKTTPARPRPAPARDPARDQNAGAEARAASRRHKRPAALP